MFRGEEKEQIPAGESPEERTQEKRESSHVEEERSPEQQAEKGKERSEERPPTQEESGQQEQAPESTSPEKEEQQKETFKEIEGILEGNIAEFYFELKEERKEKFKQEGERLTRTINSLINNHSLKTDDLYRWIHKRIKKWLSRLDADKNFISQETKIKTESILALRDPSEE